MGQVDIASDFARIWENRPGVVILLGLGFLIFLFVVVDAWRHKHRKRR